MPLPDRDTLSTYGGEMANFSDPVDPTTDEDAAWRNAYAANVAMMTRTASRGFRSFLGTTGGATAVADPSTGFIHDNVWGDSPSIKASPTHVQTGIYDLILPTTVQDELGDSHTVAVRRATASVEQSDTTLKLANATVMSAQRIRIYTYAAPSVGAAPALSNLVGDTITVFFL